jgi:hypothetical protein
MRWNDLSVYPDWYDIPTPMVSKMFRDQELSEIVQRWAYIMLGRCLYDQGELDQWQVFLFIKGAANCGKSTLLETIESFYDKQDIGTISNNIEEKFGMVHLAERFIAFADDVQGNFTMDQSNFQNAASSGKLSLAVKNGDPVTIQWKVPIVWTGNVVPNYHDNYGSVSRRWMILHLKHPVRNPDGEFKRKMMEEVAALIVKCNRAYRNCLRKNRGKAIWNIVPDAFVEEKVNLASSANHLTHFLEDMTLEIGSGKYVSMDLFCRKFMEFCQKRGFAKPKFTKAYYEGPFNVHNLTVVREKRKYGGEKEETTEWVLGCDFKDSCNFGGGGGGGVMGINNNNNRTPLPASSFIASSSSSAAAPCTRALTVMNDVFGTINPIRN